MYVSRDGVRLFYQVTGSGGRDLFLLPQCQPVTYSRLILAAKDSVTVASDETAMVYAGPGALMKGVVMNMVTTMESWFGHAEALSARAAVDGQQHRGP